MFIDNKCQRNDIFNITVNGGSTTAAFRELMQGNPDRTILKVRPGSRSTCTCGLLRVACAPHKPPVRAAGIASIHSSLPATQITNMFIPFDRIPTTLLCFSLRGYNQGGNCPTLMELVSGVEQWYESNVVLPGLVLKRLVVLRRAQTPTALFRRCCVSTRDPGRSRPRSRTPSRGSTACSSWGCTTERSPTTSAAPCSRESRVVMRCDVIGAGHDRWRAPRRSTHSPNPWQC
jgi:hypothetical protein